MSITISQTPDSQDLYIYPSGSVVTAFTNYGVAWNHNCVDDIWYSSNEDTDYVFTTSISTVSDWYSCTNHTTETGTINYVRVVGQAKSAGYAQKNTGTYRLLFGDGTSETSSSNFAPLTTSYSNYYYTWTSRPSSGTITWGDIDNLRIGIICSSPTYILASTSTVFRPNAAGDWSDCTKVGDTPNYACVDDITPDNGATYVKAINSRQTDLYNMRNHDESGTITGVTIYMVCAKGADAAYTAEAQPCFKISSSATYYGTTRSLSIVWTSYSDTYTSNPSTSANWTWSDIDNMQIGVELYSTHASYDVGCTQLYIVVNYTLDANPEIRTTQNYAVVNYTPTTSTVTLTIPQTYELGHSRNINRHIFSDGDYRVDDYGRSNKTLTISGTEDTNAFTKMNTLKTMTHYGSSVSVTGLNDTNLNTDYMIVDFHYNQEEGVPSVYYWSLTLEET